MYDKDFRDRKVLIVEDNIHFRTLLKTILSFAGVKAIQEAEDGLEALEILQDFPADVAIVDWNMERMDGLEFVRHVRREPSHQPRRRIPVLMVTGNGGTPCYTAARDAGVNDLLQKPISPKTLMKALGDVMDDAMAFIDTAAYVGPDRRRFQMDFGGMEKRQVAPSA
ncbi:response regulator [Magnetospira thiophila]